MLDRLCADPDFMSKIFFSDEATFHVSGKVNRHDVWTWGSQNPPAIQEHVRDSPKLNVWCGLSQQQVIGPFFFAEKTHKRGGTYPDYDDNDDDDEEEEEEEEEEEKDDDNDNDNNSARYGNTPEG
ncbi:hypothetical protein ANN_14084 [Periplaneta americana]|uniref:Uncharacterized protein n=1 Tax=Periplaneta americana TaxID=6978 RepID=A0ABQ8SVC2_PERAM|nr:hypothetical protein ANN_14084 [Periplaneta americana]